MSSAAASWIRSPLIFIDWFTNSAPLIHICDLIGKRVLLAVEGRDKSVWEAFAEALEDSNSP